MRAKFRLDELTIRPSSDSEGQRTKVALVTFNAVNRGDKRAHEEGTDYTGEDSIFGEATPSGTIHMTIANPDAYEALDVGASYYVDFTEATE